MTPQEHNRTLGILFLAHFGMQLVGLIFGIVMMAVMFGSIMPNMPHGDEMFGGIMIAVFVVVIVFGLVMTIPSGVAGFKLFKERPNARIWAIIASIVILLNVPLGTALGIYGIWFLFSEPGKLYYAGGESGAFPPPPEHWR